MPKLPQRIEIVRSNTNALSSMSLKSANAIARTLAQHYQQVIVTNIDTAADLQALIERAPDLAFLGMYFVHNESEQGTRLWLSDILEAHAIPHTGSSKSAHKLSINKHLAKEQMIERGVQTSPFQIIRRENEEIINDAALSFPLFVKPSDKGGGQGIDEFSVVRTSDELSAKVTKIHTIQRTDALVEEFLTGREFSVAIIGNTGANELRAMPIELVASKDLNGERILGRATKSLNTTDVRAVADPLERIELENFAIDAFRALGAQGYGRIDVRLDASGTPHFLEANLIPSLIEGYGSFPIAYELNLGLNYETMLTHIVDLALAKEPKPTLA
jgi:D-alanine-D-alanine ligase